MKFFFQERTIKKSKLLKFQLFKFYLELGQSEFDKNSNCKISLKISGLKSYKINNF